MFRYYLARDAHRPLGHHNYGVWHAIHLDSHGDAGRGWSVIVLHDHHIRPHKDWVAFPKVVDGRTPIKAKIDHTLLADLGLTGDETTLEATERLAAIHPPFEHP